MLLYAVRRMMPMIMMMALSLVASDVLAQQTYREGQHVEPAFEGWRRAEDGSINLIFGYHNENWEEKLDIPVGENNFFSPGEADRGQPTHFLPRRNRFTFAVNVDAEWADRDEEVVWEVTSPNGETRRAYATVNPDYIIDDVVIASETGSLGAGTSTPESRANTAPQVTVLGDHEPDEEIVRYARVGEPLVIETKVEDDGLPTTRMGPSDRTVASETRRALRPPTRITVGKTNGLFLSWNVYRGGDAAEFDPPQVKPWEDTRHGANSPWGAMWTPPPVPEDGMYTTEVTFDEPGTYVLWGRADDGGLFDDQWITVEVTE
ncbi:MAG: hypothetical protein WEB57_06815 [Pseudohongiellaceae bacterium]